jgi:hypothetical protein
LQTFPIPPTPGLTTGNVTPQNCTPHLSALLAPPARRALAYPQQTRRMLDTTADSRYLYFAMRR